MLGCDRLAWIGSNAASAAEPGSDSMESLASVAKRAQLSLLPPSSLSLLLLLLYSSSELQAGEKIN